MKTGNQQHNNTLARCLVTSFIIVFIICGLVSIVGLPLISDAADFNTKDYVNDFVGDTGDTWDSRMITNIDGKAASGTIENNTFISSLDKISFEIGKWIIGLSVLVCAARFAGRGICGILNVDINEAKTRHNFLWGLLLTNQERKNQSGTAQDGWVFPMIKETFLYLAIGIAASLITMLVFSGATFLINNITNSAPDNFKTLTVGNGLSVTTN